MEDIVKPIPIEDIERELTADKIVRPTQNGSNIIYIVTGDDSPNTLKEIGRLREYAFREAGGGSGLAMDLDDEDFAKDGYKQLIVWDPENKMIVGGYRFIVSRSENPSHFSTEHYFQFTDKFRKEYLPYTIELGRSFVHPKYQGRSMGAKSIYALDNLWDGLGSIAAMNPEARYYFGKVTMYEHYHNQARLILFCFLQRYFSDSEALVTPVEAKVFKVATNESLRDIFTGDYQIDYKILVGKLREYGENIPPLINAYMNLSPSMKVFGTIVNDDFGSVQETGILVTIKDIYKDKYLRYIGSAKAYIGEECNED